ncbi:RNA 2',3'-cyclic phosphodiesterase [Streptomyces sp. NPDC048172]|uniref:RNA 2',3'-cyclic phosphodiesterase n=1 Tax=Streptomyces sp. NPDC048172 TaxID=3365505 RepID=UPI003718C499
MRLFAAVLPPDPVADELARAAEGLRALPGAGELRWTERAGWHFTLAFYGEVEDPETREELRERLARAAHRAAPLTLRLAGGGRFGDRALWAGLGEGSDREPLKRLAGAAAAAGRRSGLTMDEPHGPFRPHLTLARVRRSDPVDLRPYVEALGPFTGTSWTADRLTLVHSRLPVSGQEGEKPRYEPLTSWPLGE